MDVKDSNAAVYAGASAVYGCDAAGYAEVNAIYGSSTAAYADKSAIYGSKPTENAVLCCYQELVKTCPHCKIFLWVLLPLLSYACPTRCPVLTRVCCDQDERFSSSVAKEKLKGQCYLPTSVIRDVRYWHTISACICLRACYATPGTDIARGTTHTRCPLLTYCMLQPEMGYHERDLKGTGMIDVVAAIGILSEFFDKNGEGLPPFLRESVPFKAEMPPFMEAALT
eukprot:1631150-Rhodomonas_salina.10